MSKPDANIQKLFQFSLLFPVFCLHFNKKKMNKPRLVLGLDVSTTCIGISLVLDEDNGEMPKVVLLTHVSPKIKKNIKGFEALIQKKDIFENEFLTNLSTCGITDCIIEEPLVSSNNANTVATLLRFNGMIGDAVHRVLKIVPQFISSYDARMFSFPDLVSLRRFNKHGDEYPLTHIKKAIKDNHIVLFGDYPFDIDKKSVMLNKVQDLYPDIPWVLDKKGDLKKENYDACDSLVCVLAFINLYKNDNVTEPPVIVDCIIDTSNPEYISEITYTTKIWNNKYSKKLIIHRKEEIEGQ